MLYNRLLPFLDRAQCDDQIGFRPGMRIENAFAILDGLVDIAKENNLDIWMASLDMRKAFDRIEFRPLFDALEYQGVPSSYIHLLKALYSRQHGIINDSHKFPIQRGVKQGDVLSSILFNSGLELAFSSWKVRLGNHSWMIHANGHRLTNCRYADDIMVYAKTLPELIHMIEMLFEELQKVGLAPNQSKTKILSTKIDDEQLPRAVQIHDYVIEILDKHDTHKYLGRKINVHLHPHSQIEVNHRKQQS